jgi:hypothetical protein
MERGLRYNASDGRHAMRIGSTDAGLARVRTRVFCHASLSFVVPIGIFHINENCGVE